MQFHARCFHIDRITILFFDYFQNSAQLLWFLLLRKIGGAKSIFIVIVFVPPTVNRRFKYWNETQSFHWACTLCHYRMVHCVYLSKINICIGANDHNQSLECDLYPQVILGNLQLLWLCLALKSQFELMKNNGGLSFKYKIPMKIIKNDVLFQLEWKLF